MFTRISQPNPFGVFQLSPLSTDQHGEMEIMDNNTESPSFNHISDQMLHSSTVLRGEEELGSIQSPAGESALGNEVVPPQSEGDDQGVLGMYYRHNVT